MEFNLADLFENAVDTFPEREYLVAEGQRRSYAEMEARANRLGHHLAAQGVRPGDHVGIYAYNSVEWVETLWAVFKIRAVWVNINYRYVADELEYIFNNADLKALVAELGSVPAESVAYHARRHDFSRWLRARAEFGVAAELRPRLLQDYPPVEALRDSLIRDIDRYRQLGCKSYHDNCTDNLRMALIAIGERAPAIPCPLNLWMNIPVAGDGKVQFLPTVSKPGDRMVFRAAMPAIAVISACPMDLVPINGPDGTPVDLAFEVD